MFRHRIGHYFNKQWTSLLTHLCAIRRRFDESNYSKPLFQEAYKNRDHRSVIWWGKWSVLISISIFVIWTIRFNWYFISIKWIMKVNPMWRMSSSPFRNLMTDRSETWYVGHHHVGGSLVDLISRVVAEIFNSCAPILCTRAEDFGRYPGK